MYTLELKLFSRPRLPLKNNYKVNLVSKLRIQHTKKLFLLKSHRASESLFFCISHSSEKLHSILIADSLKI